jgi:ketosteroid isomerase-like protein
MTTIHKRVLCGFIGFIGCLTAVTDAQSNADAQRAVVVRLHTHFSTNKKDETAAGVFVGKDQQYAYFITARHAVADEVGNQEVHAESTELWFHDSPQPLKAQVLDHTTAILDLGVVYIPVAEVPPNLPQIVRKDARSDTAVRIIGHPAAGDWSTWEGTVQNENAPNGDSYKFVTSTGPSLAKGYSGGPVFDPSGNFLGMHTSTTNSYGSAAKSGQIKAQLAAWHIPITNLLDAPPEPDQDALKRILREYEAAYNQRDATSLWKIWPRPPSLTKQATITLFDDTTAISRTIANLELRIAPDGSSATATGLISERAIFKDGNQVNAKNKKTSFLFKKTDGVWTIDDVQSVAPLSKR